MRHSRLTKKTLRRRRSNRLRKLRAACLSLGLATAWGGSASADVTVLLTVTPSVTLTDAVVVFGNNVSTESYFPIGDLPAGQTTTLRHTLTGEFEDAPEKLAVDVDAPFTGYYLAAGYERDDAQGVVLAFRDDAVVTAGHEWADLFLVQDSYSSYHNVIESEMLAALANGQVLDNLSSYARSGDGPSWNTNANLLNTPYGETSVLVGFSTATALGSMTVSIVPEPAAFAIVACALGVWSVGGLRRCG